MADRKRRPAMRACSQCNPEGETYLKHYPTSCIICYGQGWVPLRLTEEDWGQLDWRDVEEMGRAPLLAWLRNLGLLAPEGESDG